MVNNTLNNPPSYKEVLVLVAGATPQIITETIYALSQKQPPVYPDNIFIITLTGTNYDRIRPIKPVPNCWDVT